MSELLTDDDISELTGYTAPAKQREALDRMGVFFYIRTDGKPRTTWHHVNHPVIMKRGPSAGPNFDALR